MLSTVFGKKLLLNISKHSYHGLAVATDPSERHCDNAISSPCASKAVRPNVLESFSHSISGKRFMKGDPS